MIYSAEWCQKRIELKNLLDNYRQNVEFCGSLESLIAQYPKGYKKLKSKIFNVLTEYIRLSFKDISLPQGTNPIMIIGCWKPHMIELRESIELFSEEMILKSIESFLSEMITAFGAKL